MLDSTLSTECIHRKFLFPNDANICPHKSYMNNPTCYNHVKLHATAPSTTMPNTSMLMPFLLAAFGVALAVAVLDAVPNTLAVAVAFRPGTLAFP